MDVNKSVVRSDLDDEDFYAIEPELVCMINMQLDGKSLSNHNPFRNKSQSSEEEDFIQSSSSDSLISNPILNPLKVPLPSQ